MCVNVNEWAKEKKHSIQIENTLIEQVDSFKYLGICRHVSSSLEEETIKE